MSCKSRLLLLPLLAAATLFARAPSLGEYRAVQESLARVHPRMRASWLRERGLDDSYYTTFHRPESTGLLCVGRWPWGPSWELAGRDTFLYLGSGSGVRILSIADSIQPRMLGQINARSLVSQVVVQDSLLFVACGSWGAQIYSVRDPADPRELGSMDAVIGDLCVQDTFCYTAGGGSFRIYNFADPTQPAQVAAVSDSGDVIAEAGGYAYVGHGSSGSGLNVYDARNPHSPTLINTLAGVQLALFIRGQRLFRASVQPSYFQILDISDPSSIHEISRIDGYGGIGLYADDYFAYLSCTYDHEGLFVIDITNPANPQIRDSLSAQGTEKYDSYVPVPLSYGYLASGNGGLVTVDMHNVNNLSQAWGGYEADQSVDVALDNGRAYIANSWDGVQIVDVTAPAKPVSLGIYDTSDSRGTNTAAARDSFAFVGFSGPLSLRVLNVTDPRIPTLVAQKSCYNWPEDCVLQDSFLYVAEAYQFQVFNVARPREPVLVGSCGLSSYASDLHVEDTVAFMSGLPLTIISVAQPTNPRILSTWDRGVAGLDVVDTVLYAVGQNARFWTLSVANPSAPRPLDSITLPSYDGEDVVVIGSTAYASENVIRILDVSDPSNLRIEGQANVPYWTPRLVYAEPYLYACCAEGGVCVLETVPAGVAEIGDGKRPRGLAVLPSVTSGRLVVEVPWPRSTGELMVFDITGKEVLRLTVPAQQGEAPGRWPVDLSRLSAGVYVLRLEGKGVTELGKVVISGR